MILKEAKEIMEKDKACGEHIKSCHKEGRSCKTCSYYVDPNKLEEAKWTALRVMQAFTAAKEDIRKACGCTTAIDVMERYQKRAEEGGTEA